MTHTLHRQGSKEDLKDDIVMLSMAAQGLNDKGAAKKLSKVLDIMCKYDPINYADDNKGGVFTGFEKEQLMELANEQAYMGVVYDSKNKLKLVLKDLKDADLGMSVVATGNIEMIREVLSELELKPNSAHLSLGIMGDKSKLPEKDITEICTMCGHGMVSPSRVKLILEQINKKQIDIKRGAEILAETCTCGIFNVKRAEKILENMINT